MTKTKIAILITSLLLAKAKAETYVIPSGIGSIEVATNESILFVGGYTTVPYYKKNGVTNVFEGGFGYAVTCNATKPDVVTGPITLYFSPSMFSYRRITNSPYKTIAISCSETNNINIPTNSTARFFKIWRGNAAQINFSAVDGATVNGAFEVDYGMEIDGQLNLVVTNRTYAQGSAYCLTGCTNRNCNAIECVPFKLNGFPPQNNELCFSAALTYASGVLINYYMIDEFVSLPANGYVGASAGSLTLAVEKSFTLTNWFPVFITSEGDDQYAFYRLKISRKSNSEGGSSFIMNNVGGTVYFEQPTLPPFPH